MGGEGVQEDGEDPQLFLGDAALGGDLVHQGHQGRNGGVELQHLGVLADLLNGLVESALHVGADALLPAEDILQVPIALHQAAAALDARVGPGGGLLKVADEHLVQAHGVGAVLVDDVVGVHHVIFSPFSPRIMPWLVRLA